MSNDSAENDAPGYRCCACCEGVAKDDHVEHGGAVERDGHDLPCLSCGDEARIRERLALAWDVGYQRGLRDAEQDLQRGADNPYRASA